MANKKDAKNKAVVDGLNHNTKIIEESFSRNNLRVIGTGFCSLDDHGFITLLLEVVTLLGHSISTKVCITANMYSDDDTVICSKSWLLRPDYFQGYDTIGFAFYEENIAFNTAFCRIYANPLQK